jgi:hypothetical protein
MNETAYRNQLQIELAKHGIRVFRNVVSLLYTADGTPVKVGTEGQGDLIGWIGGSGRYLSIETKSATGRVRPKQEAWRQAVIAGGGIALICRPGDDVIGILKSKLKEYQPFFVLPIKSQLVDKKTLTDTKCCG